MIRLYFQQAFYHLRENPIITWVSVIGTALAICMIMVLVITLQVRMVDCEPEINRSRSLYVSTMAVRYKGTDHGAYGHMSVQTGKGCFKQLSTAEAVTLISLPEKVRVSLLAGAKLTADMVQTDEQFWHIFRFRFLSGKGFGRQRCRNTLCRYLGYRGASVVRHYGGNGADIATESCGLPGFRCRGRCFHACHFSIRASVGTL